MQQEQSGVYWSGKLPLDKQGFTVSFDIHHFDSQAVREFYKEYGLVVFDNVLSQDQIKLSIDDLWYEVMKENHFDKIDRNDIKTWDYFQEQSYLHYFGFVGTKPIASGKQLWKNRANHNVYKAFKRLYQITSGQTINEPLLALFDRGSMLRPSKLHPQWKTEPLPHFDINPWWWTKTKQVDDFTWRRLNEYNYKFDEWMGEGCYVPKVRNFTKLQGVLGLSDTNLQTGGFQAVCGFHNHIHRWCRQTRQNTNVGDCPNLMRHMQRIFQRAGSVTVFSRQIPHGISPNVSENTMRYAQYLRMAPESSLMLDQFDKKARRAQIRKILPREILESEDSIQQQAFMLDK